MMEQTLVYADLIFVGICIVLFLGLGYVTWLSMRDKDF